MAAVLPGELNIDNITFKDPRKNTVGGQSIYVNYQYPNTGKSGPLIMQTPKMRMPFGLDVFESDNGVSKYAINVSLSNEETSNANLKAFTKNIQELDIFTKKTAVAQSEVWFGKKQKADVLEEFYKSAEKKSKNDKYPSTLKLKLPMKTTGDKNVPQFDVYSETKELINVVDDNGLDLSCIEKGGEIVAIIQCTGIWFVGKTQFGIGWKILQVKTFRNQKLVGYSIIDDEPEEEEVEEEEEEEVEVEIDEECG